MRKDLNMTIYVFNETFTNGLNYTVITFITLTSILCGILVIISKNPIVSVLFLIGLFLSIAGYLMMLGLNFIGLSYLLVYVGAVSILFLFILMLINVRISELTSDSSNSLPLAVIIGILFNTGLYKVIPHTIIWPNELAMINKLVSIKEQIDLDAEKLDHGSNLNKFPELFSLHQDIFSATTQI